MTAAQEIEAAAVRVAMREQPLDSEIVRVARAAIRPSMRTLKPHLRCEMVEEELVAAFVTGLQVGREMGR